MSSAEPRQVGAEVSGRVDEIGQLLRRQHRPAVDQHEMQPDAQARQAPRARDRVRRGGAGDHQACRREDAAGVRGFDGFIDLAAPARNRRP